jgi:hypothetical protein
MSSRNRNNKSFQADWTCRNQLCSYLNHSYRTDCLKCLQPKVSPQVHSSSSAIPHPGVSNVFGDWTCKCCNYFNTQAHKKCSHCGAEALDWPCSCGEINFSSRQQCRKCSLPRAQPMWMPSSLPPNQSVASPSIASAYVAKPGDWICPSCQDLNFASRLACRRCKGQKPALSASVAEPSNPNEGLCAVCYSEQANTCLVTCGHIAVCWECGLNCLERNIPCPVCRVPFKPVDLIRTYKAT